MKLRRREFCDAWAGRAQRCRHSSAMALARAEAYPSRPVRIIVGFAPSGAADILARLIAQRLSERLGQPFVVENRPGAAMNIATGLVAKARARRLHAAQRHDHQCLERDRSTNISTSISFATSPRSPACRAPAACLRSIPRVPAKTVAEFIAYAKANPGKLNMGTGGPGSGPHMYGSLFEMMTGVQVGAGALSRHRPRPARSHERPASGHVRSGHVLGRLHQIRQIAAAWA